VSILLFMGSDMSYQVVVGFDGASVYARCKWCGFEGMIDSQVDLF